MDFLNEITEYNFDKDLIQCNINYNIYILYLYIFELRNFRFYSNRINMEFI